MTTAPTGQSCGESVIVRPWRQATTTHNCIKPAGHNGVHEDAGGFAWSRSAWKGA